MFEKSNPPGGFHRRIYKAPNLFFGRQDLVNLLWKNMDQVEPHGAITEITRGWPPKPHRLLRSPPSAASRDSVWKCVHFPTEKMGGYITDYNGIHGISSWWFFLISFFQTRHGTTIASTTDWLFDTFSAPWQGLQQSSFAQVNPGHLRMQQNRLMMMVIPVDGQIFDDLVQRFKSRQ